MMDSPELDVFHPRPQLRRDEATWRSLDGTWRFRFDDGSELALPPAEWPSTIRVPFAPEVPLSGIGDGGYHRVCWYEREFTPPEGDGPVLLHFGAVDYAARVWINGAFAGSHRGGHTPFTIDATPFLGPGPQRVTVRAEDDPLDLAKPRGKQDWKPEPHSIWYPRTTGIWQTVWVERVPRTYLKAVRWTPHLERWELGLEAVVAGERREGQTVRVRLFNGGQVLADDVYGVINGEVTRSIALSDPGIDDFRNELLWSPERPNLIDAVLELREGERVLDTVRSYTALRSAAIHRDLFMLNGRPYYLRFVLDQGYWPGSQMTAPSDDAFRRDIELTKAMGFNGVRKHQKVESPRYLFWADRLGLLVWEEMPSAYRFTNGAVERVAQEWMEVIERDYSHPCIVAWVPFNESWGVPDLANKAAHRHCVQALYHLTKTLDPTRPVLGNDGWESVATDILGIHDYETRPEKIRQRYGPHIDLNELLGRGRPGGRLLTVDGYPHSGQPLMLTEFGGIAYSRPGDPAADRVWGYDRSATPEDLGRKVTALLAAVREMEVFSGYCYTQLTDTFQEANGLLYADRTPKLPLEVVAAANGGG